MPPDPPRGLGLHSGIALGLRPLRSLYQKLTNRKPLKSPLQIRPCIPSFEQCKQIRATLSRRSLCGVAPARQETGIFPDRKTGDKQTGKKRKQEKEEGKTFRSERTANFGAKESTISEPKSVRPFPFLCAFFEHVEASTSPKLCLYLDKLSLCRATPRRFWLSKTDLKTALLAHYFEWKSYPL